MLAIETQLLSKKFGERAAVDRISLAVPQGCACGLLGPNGAGKSTTMRLLLGLLRPDAGSITIDGRDLLRERTDALRGVSAVLERPGLYAHLTARRNLSIAATLRELPASQIDRVLKLTDLASRAHDRVGTFSLGMRQRLALARALLGEPRLILLDEPMNGLDPEGMDDLRQLIGDLIRETGVTILMSTHLLYEAQRMCTQLAMLADGALVYNGTTAGLLAEAAPQVVFHVDNAPLAVGLLPDTFEMIADAEEMIAARLTNDEDVGRQVARLATNLAERGVGVSQISTKVATVEEAYRNRIARKTRR